MASRFRGVLAIIVAYVGAWPTGIETDIDFVLYHGRSSRQPQSRKSSRQGGWWVLRPFYLWANCCPAVKFYPPMQVDPDIILSDKINDQMCFEVSDRPTSRQKALLRGVSSAFWPRHGVLWT